MRRHGWRSCGQRRRCVQQRLGAVNLQIFACPSVLKKYSLAEVWNRDEFMPGGLVQTV
jgi:hypothetical protein